MAELYRIKPLEKKSIYAIYDVYKHDERGEVYGFRVTELYRWGQGFREMDEPVYAETQSVIVDPNLGWGCDLIDTISIDFDFDGDWTEEEKERIEYLWMNGDPDDPDMRCGPAWLYDFSDWEVEDDYVEIQGPFQVDIIDDNVYNSIIQENITLEPRPKLEPNSSWPFKN